MDNSIKNTVKLHAFMAHAGIASRRKSEELIEAGKVTVNGHRAHVGLRIDPATDTVTVENKKIETPEVHRYFLVYKPVGIISSTNDELKRKTVVDLIKDIDERLYPVGRLDQDSEGLMLLTNDGILANKLTHPKYRIPKIYQITVDSDPTRKALEHLRRGVKLADGYTHPVEVEIVEQGEHNTILEMTIYEGRNRQVRRMMDRIGYPVLKLVRVKMGPFTLDDLEGQKSIEVSKKQIKQMFNF